MVKLFTARRISTSYNKILVLPSPEQVLSKKEFDFGIIWFVKGGKSQIRK